VITAIKNTIYIFFIFAVGSFLFSQDSTQLEISPKEEKFINIIVLNEGVIGLSQMEANYINSYIQDEISKISNFKIMQDSDLKENGYSGCLDDDCLSILSQKLGVENFILWTLTKKDNKYTGTFNRFNFSEQNKFKKNKVKLVSMNIQTDIVDEMIQSIRFYTWKVLEVDPPQGTFDDIIKKQSSNSRLFVIAGAVGLVLLAIAIDNGSIDNGPASFESPPGWPGM
jgi:hypothetical protein